MQTLYYNGTVLTLDKDLPEQETADALLVTDGVITAVGAYGQLLSMTDATTETVDLCGTCLCPGFIDGHSHAMGLGRSYQRADLSSCTSFADIVKTLRQYIDENHIDETGVVVANGYDQNFLKEQDHPKRAVLDRVSQTVPLYVRHISGHVACANTAALRLAGVTADTVSPPGGLLEKDEDGTPTGYFEEAAMSLVSTAAMKRLVVDDDRAAEEMQEAYLSHGYTTIQECSTSDSRFAAVKRLSDRGGLKLDVVAYPLFGTKGCALYKEQAAYDGTYHNRLKIGGYKIVLDGSPQARSAWLSRPYEGETEFCGYPRRTDEWVENAVYTALSEHRQLLAHCNGDAASEQFISAFLKFKNEFPDMSTTRPTMIHCQTVRTDQLEKMAQIGMIASIFVGHVWYWGDIHLKNLGKQRGERISPVAEALQKGVAVNFHQDTPITPPDMLHSVWCAVNRVSRGGQTVGKAQAVETYTALKLATLGGAYAYFEENEKGTLSVGKRADMVRLDRSPLAVPKEEIKNITVLETVKDGITVWHK